MRLLVFNLAMDDADPVLAFAARWVVALAKHVESVDVITMRSGPFAAPGNVRVRSVGKERGWTEARRVVEFYRHLRAVVPGVDACFSHMIPIFTVLGAPILRLNRIPIATWYAHRAVTTVLRMAHHLSDRVVTSAETSYRYRADEALVLGQGIDTQLFAPDDSPPDDPPLILSVGRLSPIKRLDVLLDAVARVRAYGIPLRCALVGEAPERDRAYAESLRQQAARLGLADAVEFGGAVPYASLPGWYRRAAVHVNASPTGALDKAALEAMACGRPSVVMNAGFADTLGPWADELIVDGGAEALSRRLGALLTRRTDDLTLVGRSLRARVRERHDLQGLTDKLVDVLGQLAAARRLTTRPGVRDAYAGPTR